MINNIHTECVYFCFPGTGVISKSTFPFPASEIDLYGNLVKLRYPIFYVEMCKEFLLAAGHTRDEKCAVWRYVFFTEYPNTQCVRQVRISENLVAVGEISEV